ncbi:hypothetical protein THAOC_06872, partial [Thalassiosira oceanica]
MVCNAIVDMGVHMIEYHSDSGKCACLVDREDAAMAHTNVPFPYATELGLGQGPVADTRYEAGTCRTKSEALPPKANEVQEELFVVSDYWDLADKTMAERYFQSSYLEATLTSSKVRFTASTPVAAAFGVSVRSVSHQPPPLRFSPAPKQSQADEGRRRAGCVALPPRRGAPAVLPYSTRRRRTCLVPDDAMSAAVDRQWRWCLDAASRLAAANGGHGVSSGSGGAAASWSGEGVSQGGGSSGRCAALKWVGAPLKWVGAPLKRVGAALKWVGGLNTAMDIYGIALLPMVELLREAEPDLLRAV